MGILRKNSNLIIILALDILLFIGAFYTAHLIRFDTNITSGTWKLFLRALPVLLLSKLLFFYLFDLYRGMWRYTSIADLFNIIKASTLGTLLIVFILLIDNRFEGFSRSVFIIDWLLTIVLVSGIRLMIRFYFEGSKEGFSYGSIFLNGLGLIRSGIKEQKRLLIIGAGDCGEKMYREIRDNGRLKYRVIGFLDDNPVKVGKKIHGVPVLGTVDLVKTIAEKTKAEEVLISIPSAHGQQMRRIVDLCKKCGVKFRTVPSMGELIDGRLSISAIREVAYRDLLGREVIRLDKDKIGGYLGGQCVLITGAGGSIGSELCRQICRYRPKRLVLFERAESALYDIQLELLKNFKGIEIVALLADIQDFDQVDRAFRKYRPHTIFHAAAYKHVPMLESQPWNPVKNNVLGTMNLIDAAKSHAVGRFVFVSTDKAVRPTNVMGASKRVAEMLIQNQNGCDGDIPTRFISVRFGNVVGSAGSVVPLFKKQIEAGGPITVTHPEVTRYFMMIPEACQLILQAGGMGQGGEIFILDMGSPIKIAEMAKDLVRLSGLEPDVDIMIEHIGLRPGEKLYEELITEGEGILPTSHEKIMVFKGMYCDMHELRQKIKLLSDAADAENTDRIRRIFREIVPEYHYSDDGHGRNEEPAEQPIYKIAGSLKERRDPADIGGH